ncbi:hypothetical protein RG836_10010 [Pseudomonas sp. SZMC_28357]|uniref:hypothetical protein n=1 Tax=Pseudomonas sp. SZMC_28357 TaxID=3074380 RepID=UPI002871D47E|nr:hypothetical protein [Pseudomonas sp. SZMC_28357]MDR9751784.1 hypothetical protein [Pseudomonas sp. SZMC_28357]
MTFTPPLRQPCPPGACDCDRERLLAAADSDLRILRLTRQEEKVLVERLERIDSLADLERLQEKMYAQLGIRLEITPSLKEVKTMRGIQIRVEDLPGLCRKTRLAIPKAIRRALEQRPEIAFELLNARDLLRDA